MISGNIKRLRFEKGLPARLLAKDLGVAPQQLSRWESGKQGISVVNKKKIADYFGITVEQLTNGHHPDTDTDIFSPIQEALIRKLAHEQLILELRLSSSSNPHPWLVQAPRKFPKKPESMTEDESFQWDMNELCLYRWANTPWFFDVPAWALEKFCLEVVALYEGGRLQDVTGLLKDFIAEREE